MHSRHPLYFVWTSMIQRCHQKHHKAYKWYGARGIRVCAKWRRSFKDFVADMGERPTGYTLERIDSNKGYSPRNCKWASQKEQQRNRTNTKLTMEKANQIRKISQAGELSQEATAKQYGVSRRMVRKIIKGDAWA